MKNYLLPVVLGGLAIGFFVEAPSSEVVKAPETTAKPPAEAKPRRAPSSQSAQPAATARWGGETRLAARGDGHFYATALVNGQPIEFVVDTGASTVALTVDDARRAGLAVDTTRFDVVGTGASGPVRGHPVTIQRIAVDGREVRAIQGVVLEGLEVSLLGQSYLSRMAEVRMSGGEMILR